VIHQITPLIQHLLLLEQVIYLSSSTCWQFETVVVESLSHNYLMGRRFKKNCKDEVRFQLLRQQNCCPSKRNIEKSVNGSSCAGGRPAKKPKYTDTSAVTIEEGSAPGTYRSFYIASAPY
jgi:hypothetical protein